MKHWSMHVTQVHLVLSTGFKANNSQVFPVSSGVVQELNQALEPDPLAVWVELEKNHY